MTSLLGGRSCIGIRAEVVKPWGLCPPFGVHRVSPSLGSRVPPSLVEILVYPSTRIIIYIIWLVLGGSRGEIFLRPARVYHINAVKDNL
jgi:hypothetical protein